jgi:branched-chain amino acid transport system permease protein
MAEFLQYLIAGLSSGGTYALIALGWVIIFNVSGVLNLAQGEFLMISGCLFAWLAEHTGLPLLVTVVLAIGAGVVAAVVLDVAAIRRVRSGSIVPMILMTLGAAFVFREIGRILFGADALRHEYLVQGSPIIIFGAALLPQTILVWAIDAAVLVALAIFFRRTVYGKAMTACSDDPVGAQTVGISPSRMRTVAFAISGALAGISGVLIVSLTSMSWDGGTVIGLKGFIAAVVGGLGSYEGAIAGALALGLLESLGAGYVSSEYKDVLSLALLVVMLIVRPQGILRGRAVAA